MYKCPACGRIITEEQYIEEQESGGGGYCLCEFSATDPDTGEVWFPRIYHEMVEVKWWEMLDWNQMETTWNLLSEGIKNEIRGAGLAPDFDTQILSEKGTNENEA